MQPTDGDEAKAEDVLHSHVAHGAGTDAAHSIDAAAAHHLPLLVAQEAAKHGGVSRMIPTPARTTLLSETFIICTEVAEGLENDYLVC